MYESVRTSRILFSLLEDEEMIFMLHTSQRIKWT